MTDNELNENQEDLNEQIEDEVDEATVITVPIDDTLSNSGEAADAKAVGDALELKADKSELATAITIDGQTADDQGVILLYGTHIPISGDEEANTVKQEIDAIKAWDANDIVVDKSATPAVTVQEKLEDLDERSGADIDLTANPNDGTIGAAIAALEAEFTDAEIHQMLVDAGYEEDDSNE